MDSALGIIVTLLSVLAAVGLLLLVKRLGGERLQEVRNEIGANWIVRVIAIAVIALLLWLTLSRKV